MKNKIHIIFSFLCFSLFLNATISASSTEDYEKAFIEDSEMILADTVEWQGDVFRLAVVMSDIYSKKDMEFMRGFLYGIDQTDLPSGSIALKVVNGDIPVDSLIYELELFNPDLILSTNEREVPQVLVNYSDSLERQLVNVFDPKSNDYISHRNIFQLFTPSNIFSDNAANYFKDNFADNILVIIGVPDPSDIILQDLILAWPEENLYVISKEELPTLVMDEGFNYLFYPASSSNEDVKSILEESLKLMADNPITGVRIIGRPNWVMFGNFNTMLSNLEVYIPVKCYFDSSSSPSKRFLSGYKSKFGHTPLKSYPVYAAMGYDVARYFLSTIASDDTDIGKQRDQLQMFVDFEKEPQGGHFNKGAYILHFEPWGTMQKELIN